jgi:hypothetical protein
LPFRPQHTSSQLFFTFFFAWGKTNPTPSPRHSDKQHTKINPTDPSIGSSEHPLAKHASSSAE